MRETLKLSYSLLIVGIFLLVPMSGVQAQDGGNADEIADTPGEEITFYGHVFGIGRDLPMPLNTQFPEGEGDYSIGYANGCGGPPPAPEDEPTGELYGNSNEDCEGWPLNEEYFYTTAGFVQVKSWEEWGEDYSKFHNERGQTKDIFLDTTQTARSTFYMSADFHGWLVLLCDAACWNWDPGYYQDWVVESWIWHASLGEWSSDPSDPPSMQGIARREADDQKLVAHGKTEPSDLLSLDPTLPSGEQTVWPFDIEYEWGEEFDGRVPYENDLIVEFEWYQETDGQKYIIGGGAVAPNWNVNSGEDYPNNVVLPVRNPLDVELVFPRFIHDKLVILSVINTPWGSYDIQHESIEMTIRDGSGNVVTPDPDLISHHTDSSVAHAGHYNPINTTWIWDYQEQGLEPGDYTIEVAATNFQESYSTSTEATFTIDKKGVGGEVSSGQSGLQSFTEEQLESFKEGATQGVDTPDADADLDGASNQEQENEDSPSVGVLILLAVLGAVAVVARRSRR